MVFHLLDGISLSKTIQEYTKLDTAHTRSTNRQAIQVAMTQRTREQSTGRRKIQTATG